MKEKNLEDEAAMAGVQNKLFMYKGNNEQGWVLLNTCKKEFRTNQLAVNEAAFVDLDGNRILPRCAFVTEEEGLNVLKWIDTMCRHIGAFGWNPSAWHQECLYIQANSKTPVETHGGWMGPICLSAREDATPERAANTSFADLSSGHPTLAERNGFQPCHSTALH
eukprot:TRINITY_DN545_c0_g2_i1.p1 TRINITY_DN545_c0_g2~~TRINITY_DN545_c0_g2_i1.p1  ORF type:complete len:165 (+),score=17.29 TRINITY_DN545_c0_g2_i1:1327-1821(+)